MGDERCPSGARSSDATATAGGDVSSYDPQASPISSHGDATIADYVPAVSVPFPYPSATISINGMSNREREVDSVGGGAR